MNNRSTSIQAFLSRNTCAHILTLAIAAAVAGCGMTGGAEGPQGETGPEGPQGPPGEDGAPGLAASGERLKARYIVGDDGSRQRTGDWLDTITEVPCSFREATDGETRCVPADLTASTARYLDADCTQWALLLPADSPPPPEYVSTFPAPKNVSKAIHVQVGSPLPVPAAAYSILPDDGTCVAVQGDLSMYDFYSVEQVLPPSFFVAGTVVAE